MGRPKTKEPSIIFTVPVAMMPALREFTQKNGYRHEREALHALVEGAMNDYPKWGVKKGVVARVSAEARHWIVAEMRIAIADIERRLIENFNQPLDEDMVQFDSEPE